MNGKLSETEKEKILNDYANNIYNVIKTKKGNVKSIPLSKKDLSYLLDRLQELTNK